MRIRKTSGPGSFGRPEIKDVKLGRMQVMEIAQRKRDNAWIDHLHSNFDPDQIGHPIVSYREGHYNIVDGQHRIEALKKWLGGDWENQQVRCLVYSGLSEKDEAELFLRYNDVRQVRAFDKFRVGVSAGRAEEVEITKIVEAAGFRVSTQSGPGLISAVGALRKVHTRAGAEGLAAALRLLSSAYGDSVTDGPVIEGFGHLCKRYNGTLDEKHAAARLSAARGGVKNLMQRARLQQHQTGNSLPLCVAAAAVDIINVGRGGKKLAPWWREL